MRIRPTSNALFRQGARLKSYATTPRLLRVISIVVLGGLFACQSHATEKTRKVVWQEVRENGLVATYLRPKGTDTLSAVMVVGGSEGGMRAAERMAYRLAERGFAALAVAYFGVDGLPPALANIPLEYFDGAVSWLRQQPRLKTNELTIVGASRGGELALLLAANNPAFNRVIAIVPSHVSWGPVGSFADKTTPAWTRGGQPVPFVPPSREHNYSAKPYYGTPDFLADLRQTEKAVAATIPVENIRGAVLLLSGDDDQIWPSSFMSRLVIKRLKAASHPYRNEHVSFAGAGHVIGPGADPGLIEGKHPIGIVIALGGTKRANVAAQKAGWTKILEFMSQEVAVSAPTLSITAAQP